MTYTAQETRMAQQLECEVRYGMKNVRRSAEDMKIIQSLQAKSHTARYGN